MEDQVHRQRILPTQPGHDSQLTKIAILNNEVEVQRERDGKPSPVRHKEFFLCRTESSTPGEYRYELQSVMSPRCLVVVTIGAISTVSIVSASAVGIVVPLSIVTLAILARVTMDRLILLRSSKEF